MLRKQANSPCSFTGDAEERHDRHGKGSMISEAPAEIAGVAVLLVNYVSLRLYRGRERGGGDAKSSTRRKTCLDDEMESVTNGCTINVLYAHRRRSKRQSDAKMDQLLLSVKLVVSQGDPVSLQ